MAEEKKKSQADKMYGNSPKMERDEESGKVAVKKKAMDKEEGEDEAGTGDGLPVHTRHAMERLDMHHAHEREHHTHDAAKHGDKKEMHERHEKAMKEMHTRHEKELGGKKE